MCTEELALELHRIANGEGGTPELRAICKEAALKIDALMGWNDLDRKDKIIRDYQIGVIWFHEAVAQLKRLGYTDHEINQMSM